MIINEDDFLFVFIIFNCDSGCILSYMIIVLDGFKV